MCVLIFGLRDMAMPPLTLSLKTAHKALPKSVYTRTDDGFVATFEVDNWPGVVVQHVRSAIVNEAGVCAVTNAFTEAFLDLPGRDHSADHFVVPKDWMYDKEKDVKTGGALAFSGTAWAVLQDRDAMTHNKDNSVITTFRSHQTKREAALIDAGLEQGTVGTDPWGTAYGARDTTDADEVGKFKSAPMARRAIVVWDENGDTKLFAEHGVTTETDPLDLATWELFFDADGKLDVPGGSAKGKRKAMTFEAMTTLKQARAYFSNLMGRAGRISTEAKSPSTSREQSPEYFPHNARRAASK